MAQNTPQKTNTTEHNLSAMFNRRCMVKLSQKITCNDFVFVNVSGTSRIAKIEEIYDNNKRALVKWYIGFDEIKQYARDFNEITRHRRYHIKRELFEYSIRSENILLSHVCGKCYVFYSGENNLDDVLRSKEMLDKYANEQIYVCRYKLVKKTVYTLMPVEWSCEEEERQNRSGEFDTDDSDNDDDDNYRSINLSDEINELYLSTMSEPPNHDGNDADGNGLRVTPIKIVDSSVVKLKRNTISDQVTRKAKATDDSDNIDGEQVSPSKRSRYEDEANQNYLTESPRTNRCYSPHKPEKLARMTQVKKNLLEQSFNSTADDIDDSFGSPLSSNTPSYTSKIVASENNKSVKMVLRKSRTPLKEQHDNVRSPHMNLRHKVLEQSITTDAMRTPKLRSSLRPNDGSGKTGTPRRTVNFTNDTKEKAAAAAASTCTPRRSTRISNADTTAMMQVCMMEDSPDMYVNKTPRSRKTVPKTSAPSTPKSRASIAKAPSSAARTPQQTRKLYRAGDLTPSIQAREAPVNADQTELEMVRERLHVSAVPTSLPCRDKEFDNIYNFVVSKLMDGCGGCIYISGVPGTGKTATVTQVIQKIKTVTKSRKMPAFDYVDINGMRLTEPRQAYVQIYRQLTGKTLAWAQARDLLESHFTDPKKKVKTTVLLVDELDIICNRKQDVVYNLFDWTARKGSRLVAITIANTMDLPERVLKLKVASRLGLTRITFQPYSFKQLQEVVMARLAGSKCFVSDAVQLVARKVASVSGDCRRALDICRRATEIAEEVANSAKERVVNFAHVNQALTEMFASPRVRAIKSCTTFEKLFLQAAASEITRTGIEEVDFYGVLVQIATLAPLMGVNNPPEEDQAMQICMTLASNRLIIAEDSSAGLYQKIILNVSVDDLYYALNLNNA